MALADERRAAGSFPLAGVVIVLLISLLYLAPLSLLRFFDHDEFEHIHAAWLMLQNKIPYRDFYNGHNPLLWMVLAPIVKTAGESIATLFAARALMLLCLVGIVWLAARLAHLAFASSEIAVLAPLFLLTNLLFVEKAIEVRPDVPMTFFGSLATYLFFLSRRGGSRGWLLPGAGCCMGISFVFLQKAVFWLGGIMLLLAIERGGSFRGKIRRLFVFSLGCSVPLLGLLLFLALTHSLHDYFLTGLRLHLNQTEVFYTWGIFYRCFRQNPVFWLFGVAGVACGLIRRKQEGETGGALPVLALVLAGAFAFAYHPNRQYYLPLLTVLSVLGASVAGRITGGMRISRRVGMPAMIVLMTFGAVPPFAELHYNRNSEQLRLIEYVLARTEPADFVYDGNIRFNLFRPDLHYFWYSLRPGRGKDTYHRVCGKDKKPYDIYGLIDGKKPKIISNSWIDMQHPVVSCHYRATPFPGIYARIGESEE
jgi:4-amino-4-deoxy-L-arabinose transferase-like glycosyltransferase